MIMTADNLSPTNRRIFESLIMLKRDGQPHSRKNIAARADCSVRAVSGALRKLESLGFITREYTEGTGNSYTINISLESTCFYCQKCIQF